MEEILEKLLTTDLLSEETKTEISEAWAEAVEAKKSELREEVEMVVRAELAEQFVEAREALVEKVDAFITEQVEKQFIELKSDIERFRDLEAEYAGKLVEEKKRLAEEVEQEIDNLVDKIDSFLELRLNEEIEEMKEDLEIVKENQFGKKVFEAFVNEYAKSFVDEEAVQSKLSITESKLEDVQKRLKEMEDEKAQLIREQKMEQVLKPLTGSKREQMQFILQNVETEKLEEGYNHFIKRILKEDTEVKPTPVVSETVKETVLKTGDSTTVITEQKTDKSGSDLQFIKRLAGIKS